MIIKLFSKQKKINNKTWKQDLLVWSIYDIKEIVFLLVGFILGTIIF